MGKEKDISDSDINLFRSSVGDVARIRHDQVEPVHKRRTPHRKRITATHVTSEPAQKPAFVSALLEPGDSLLFKRAGVQSRVMEKLRRGQFNIDAELDLHGMTVTEATAACIRFFEHSKELDYRCVRIIHGKGRGSPDSKPALKNHLNYWLRQHNHVQAFTSAPQHDGGTGAVYVLLKHS